MPVLAGDTAFIRVCVEFDAALDTVALAAAYSEVAARIIPNRQPDDYPFTVDAVDLSYAPEPREAATRWMESVEERADGHPGASAHLLTLGPQHQILYLYGPRIVDELAAAYSARVGGSVDVRGPRQQHRPTLTDDAGPSPRADDFWTRELDALPAPVRLSDRRLPESATSLRESATLSTTASTDLRSVAERCGVAVEAVVVAAVTGFLGALCRSDEVAIGVPTPIRADTGESVIATLPVRMSCAPSSTIDDLVLTAGSRLGEVRAYRRTWLSEPRRDRFAVRDAGPIPVVDVIAAAGPVRFGDIDGDVFIVNAGPIADLRVNVYNALDDRIRVDLEAHPGLYTRAEVHGHHARLVAFLGQFASVSRWEKIAALDVVGFSEYIEIVDEWNATAELLPPATVADLLEMGMARDDERIALIDGRSGSEPVSYGELNCRVNQLTRMLVCSGVTTESVVGVMTTDRGAGITAMLAVVRAGGVVLPLDPAGTLSEITDQIDTASPLCVITDRVLGDITVDDAMSSSEPTPMTAYDAIPPWVETIALDTSHVDEFPDDPLATGELTAPVRLSNAAWVTFPRNEIAEGGALMTHRAIANRLLWSQAAASTIDDEPVAIGSAWLWDSLLPLTMGLTIDLGDTTGPRGLVAGADDAACGVLSNPVDAQRPVWNSSVFVLDARLRPLPAGVVGDLYVAGDQLPREFCDEAAVTATSIVANPFRPGTRMCRTGVSARWRTDGTVETVEPMVAAPTVTTVATASSFAEMMDAAAPSDTHRRGALDTATGRPASSITYRELDDESDRWARLLIACDVGPGDVVAVALPHGIDAVTAVWSVVKSGASYVRVDPSTADDPSTRDADVAQLLSTSDVGHGFTDKAGSVTASAHARVRWMIIDSDGFRTVVNGLRDDPHQYALRRTRFGIDTATVESDEDAAHPGSRPAPVDRWTAGTTAAFARRRPESATGLLVLDRQLRPLPPGTPGELYLTGPVLADGHRGHTAVTPTYFVTDRADADSDDEGSVLYPTGDIVAMGFDGRVTYVGRRD